MYVSTFRYVDKYSAYISEHAAWVKNLSLQKYFFVCFTEKQLFPVDSTVIHI